MLTQINGIYDKVTNSGLLMNDRFFSIVFIWTDSRNALERSRGLSQIMLPGSTMIISNHPASSPMHNPDEHVLR